MMLNHYIEALEKNHRSDVILVQYPGGLQRYDEDIYRDFGGYSYIVSQAISSDCFLCCFALVPLTPDYLSKLSTAFMYKYGTPIHTAFLSNMELDVLRSHEENKQLYVTVSDSRVDAIIHEYQSANFDIPVYRNLKSQNYSTAFDGIMKTLESFGDVS